MPPSRVPRRIPVARALTALCGAWCLYQLGPWSPRLLAPGVLLVLLLGLLVLVARSSRRTVPDLLVTVVLCVALGVGALGWATTSPSASDHPALIVVVTTTCLAAALLAVLGPPRAAAVGWVVLALVYMVVSASDIVGDDVVTIDVQLLVEEGIDAMLSGSSPYAISIRDIYPPEVSAVVYGPGVVVDGYLTYGYSYLPVPLLLDTPGHLLGDARWVHLGALLLTALLTASMATDVFGRLCATLLLLNPISSLVLLKFWVEPLMGALLALTVWCLLRRRPGAGVALGLLLASKQYAISYLPVLWSVWRQSSARVVGVALATAGAIVVAFAVPDIAAFRRSAVEFMFAQSFREDAMSLLPGLVEVVGPLPEWALAVSPLIGLAASGVLAARTVPGPTSVALGVGVGLLATVLFSKIAFMNYYHFVGTALLLASVTWPSDDPVRTEDR